MQPNLQLLENTPVSIRWEDSTFEPGWHYPDGNGAGYASVAAPKKALTFGVIVANSATHLTIASTIAEGKSMLNPMVLPWGCILEVKKIKASQIELPASNTVATAEEPALVAAGGEEIPEPRTR